MKTDIDIKDEFYCLLRDSELAGMLTGRVSKTGRPPGSEQEDAVISVLAHRSGEIQEAFVVVRIYVPDVVRTDAAQSWMVEDTVRLRELWRAAADLLERGHGPGYLFRLEEQTLFKVEGRDEHCIYFKLLYKYSNR